MSLNNNEEPPVLLLPGWLNSGPGHWQTRWEQRHGDTRVEQADWHWPRRGDWMARLEEVLLDQERPVLLAAHSLGCLLVAAWAAHSQHTSRVRGALLVAPPDLGQPETPVQLRGWWPPLRSRLPFATRVVYSDDDPFCAVSTAVTLAHDWGAAASAIGPRGHVNAESGLGDWIEGRGWLVALAATHRA